MTYVQEFCCRMAARSARQREKTCSPITTRLVELAWSIHIGDETGLRDLRTFIEKEDGMHLYQFSDGSAKPVFAHLTFATRCGTVPYRRRALPVLCCTVAVLRRSSAGPAPRALWYPRCGAVPARC